MRVLSASFKRSFCKGKAGFGSAFRAVSASSSCAGYATNAKDDLKRTVLYDFHVNQGAKMVPFCGWSMPVQYKDGVLNSHHHTRSHTSIFDVSHMLQFKLHGKDRVKCLESLVVADIEGLNEHQGMLSVFTNEQGGIRDDLIINKLPNELYVVSNAGCADKVTQLMKEKCAAVKEEMDVTLEILDYRSLIALQGPEAVQALQGGMKENLNDLYFMNGLTTDVFDIADVRVTRCGYTGEDGFELSVHSKDVEKLCETLLSSKVVDVRMAGLAPRDSLRLEAGLCLYGNDIDETTTPVEATLLWTIGKRRRANADFPGADIILKQISEKPSRKRVGIISSGPPARAGAAILDADGNEIGKVTSGCPSPCLPKQNIAMGYVQTKHAKNGSALQLQVHKKLVQATVTKMPFVPTTYYLPKKS
ncbi:Aminomethyltransferase, mitochondrial [Paramuricea clavata]|uniref:Aminomethyltransferase n=1 Tax=Paramuricea clavata TaxID=317549 RepID=A0A7D9HZN8_PARCT|nr:Aminomethyltransferase, mitochondrial [Paramuricea clavata]